MAIRTICTTSGVEKLTDNKPRYCLATNTRIDICPNEKCPMYPCSFAQFVKEVSKIFSTKGFSNKKSAEMGRTMMLAVSTGDANGFETDPEPVAT